MILQAAAELFFTTGEEVYREVLRSNQEYFYKYASEIGWIDHLILYLGAIPVQTRHHLPRVSAQSR